MDQPLVLSSAGLSLSDVVDVARNMRQVRLDSGLIDRFEKTRAHIEKTWMHDDAPLVYSLNTGVGAFKDRRVNLADIEQYQRNMILSHATGIGSILDEDVVRAILLLRLNAFAADVSGISPIVAQRFVDFLNAGLTPVVPSKGSVGASGDLAPLAHLSGALCGFDEAEILYLGERLPAADALAKAGLDGTLSLQAKDASALLNGSTVSLAIAVLAIVDADNIAVHADIGLALSLEAMRGERDAFDAGLHAVRPHKGQALVARNIRALTGGSHRMAASARNIVFPGEDRAPEVPGPQRIQDPYSLRCGPQVHGPVREALTYARGIIETEVNSATDNPLILHDGDHRRALSGGHFHGQYVAQAMDFLAIALADLASIAERRTARLIDPVMGFGLPRNLASGTPGLNTGYATVQCSMSALVMESRSLSAPGSVDSIPGKGNSEDHVSNSTWCARKAATVVENTRAVISGEILVAAQALSTVETLAADHPVSPPIRNILATLRQSIPYRQDGDCWFALDMQAADQVVTSGDLIQAARDFDALIE